MVTIRSIIDRVQLSLNQGVPTDLQPISNRAIYSKIRQYRSLVIKQMLNGRQYVSLYFYQGVRIPLKYDMFNGMQILSGKVPVPISSNFGPAIQSITLDTIKLDIINMNQARYIVSGNKYSNNKPCVFFAGDKIYLVNNINARFINLYAIFDDVISVHSYNNREITDYLGLDLCVDESIVDSLTKLTIEGLFPGVQHSQQEEEQNG